MNLSELLASLLAKDNVLHYKLLKDNYDGVEKIYTFWLQNNDNMIYTTTLKILITDLGEPTEEATLYNPYIIDTHETPFEDAITNAIPYYLDDNPTVEFVHKQWVDESALLAEYTIYDYDESSNKIDKKNLLVFKTSSSGVLKTRELEKSYTIDEVAEGFARVIHQGIKSI